MVSIILPTYNEVQNIKLIIPRLIQALRDENIEAEIIIVDDNSPDGTADMALAIAEQYPEPYPVRVHVRKHQRNLSTAVMKGFELAKGEICVVMDADLSHPVGKLPDMIKPIAAGKCDATVGTRYLGSGGFKSWPILRKLLSKGSGVLARGLTTLSDPTSGFMAIRKSILDGVRLDPVGWKIVLEVMVKAKPRIMEIPIVFDDRQAGKSKLGLNHK